LNIECLRTDFRIWTHSDLEW